MKTYVLIKDKKLVIIHAKDEKDAFKIIHKDLNESINKIIITQIEEMVTTDGLTTFRIKQ